MSNKLVGELREALRQNEYPRLDRRIYCISDRVIGKRHSNKDDACKEYEMGRFLYDNGISVPEMYQFVPPESGLSRLFHLIPIDDWFILMQRINGVPLQYLSEKNEWDEAEMQYISGIKKIMELGICPEDAIWNFFGNLLFVPEEGRLYFIDFEHWYKVTREDDMGMEMAYKWIDRFPLASISSPR